MKKPIAMLLAATMSLGTVMLAASCMKKPSDDTPVDEKTVSVRLYKAGFGDEFIYELKQKFEAAYADKGYKMKIYAEQGYAGTPMVQEMSRGYDKTNIDLYITGAIMPNHVSKIGEYGEVCEDLEELVFNQTAINYDGTETTDKISERIIPDFEPFLRADDGTMYGFTWLQTSAGMVVNTEKLAAYGVTELPRTTDEMFEVFDMIKNGANGVAGSAETKTYPITYNLAVGTGGASTYQTCAFKSWFAQYDLETYNEFLRMETQSGDTWTAMEDGWKVFDNPNLKEVLEVSFRFMDAEYSSDDSGTQDLEQAQHALLKDPVNNFDEPQNNAVFMLNGDWYLNEVKANAGEEKLGQLAFMNVPVISTLGIKLFGAGTAYNLSNADCDDLLSYICKLVDENKSIDEIIAAVKTEKNIDLAKADAEAVATARGICFTRGIEHLAFITKGSTKKDMAALVLRMMASDDYAETFMRLANGSSPYTRSAATASKYPFINQAAALTYNVHFHAINGRIQGTRRSVLVSDYMFPGESNLAKTLRSRAANTSYAAAAQAMYDKAIADAKAAWEEYHS